MSEERDVFLSYSRKDSRFVDLLEKDLKDHQITVWRDTLEIKPGDYPRARIEDAIESCRYFCLVVSEHSMKSFYVRQLEIEAAFTKMIRDGRQGNILPVIRSHPKAALPLMIGGLHYLDFTTHSRFTTNMEQLIRAIKEIDRHFTGSRLYKNLDTSLKGVMVGVGPISQVPHHGASVRLHFQNGRVEAMDTFTDGKPDGAKRVVYDAEGRVSEITLFRNNLTVDTWRYIYDPKTGLRTHKHVYRPGCQPHLILAYNSRGCKIEEQYLSNDGMPDSSRGYVRTTWDDGGNGVGINETHFDADGQPVGSSS